MKKFFTSLIMCMVLFNIGLAQVIHRKGSPPNNTEPKNSTGKRQKSVVKLYFPLTVPKDVFESSSVATSRYTRPRQVNKLHPDLVRLANNFELNQSAISRIRTNSVSNRFLAQNVKAPFSFLYQAAFATESAGNCMVNNQGCLQIKPDTAQRFRLKPGQVQQIIPSYQFFLTYLKVQAGAGKFKLNTLPNQLLAVYGYNRGEGSLKKGVNIAKRCKITTININTMLFDTTTCRELIEYRNKKETQDGIRHVSRVLAYYKSFSQEK